MLRVFVLGETHVGGIKIVKGCINVVNVSVQFLKGPTKGNTRRIQGCRDTTLTVLIDEPNDAHLVDQRTVGGVY